MVFILTPISFFLVLWASYVSSTDAQGAIVFLIIIPLCFYFSRLSMESAVKANSSLKKYIAKGLRYFLILFVVTAFFPAPFSIPNLLISGVSNAFKELTGETPYQRERRLNDVQGMLDKLVAESPNGPIDFSKIDPTRDWDRVCFLDPAMDDSRASRLVSSKKFKLSPFIATYKEKTIVILFMDGDEMSYIIHYPVSKYDFSQNQGTCLKRN